MTGYLEEETVPTRDPMNRRSALAIVFGAIVALGGGIASVTLGFLGNSLRRRPARPWVRVGPAEDLSAETFQRVVVSVEQTHAWIEKMIPMTIFVKDLYPEGDPLAFLSVCSHLGCSVNWNGEEKRFECPCHGGVYDQQGKVVDGPPPRPLTRLETKVEGEAFYVRLPESGVG